MARPVLYLDFNKSLNTNLIDNSSLSIIGSGNYIPTILDDNGVNVLYLNSINDTGVARGLKLKYDSKYDIGAKPFQIEFTFKFLANSINSNYGYRAYFGVRKNISGGTPAFGISNTWNGIHTQFIDSQTFYVPNCGVIADKKYHKYILRRESNKLYGYIDLNIFSKRIVPSPKGTINDSFNHSFRGYDIGIFYLNDPESNNYFFPMENMYVKSFKLYVTDLPPLIAFESLITNTLKVNSG